MALLEDVDRLSAKEIEVGVGFGILSKHPIRRWLNLPHYLYATHWTLLRVENGIGLLLFEGSEFGLFGCCHW